MMFNPMQIMQTIRGGNPQQMLMSMMKQNAGNNPVLNNALNMAEKGDMDGVEQLAKNLCKERGIDPDNAVKQIMNQFGMK